MNLKPIDEKGLKSLKGLTLGNLRVYLQQELRKEQELSQKLQQAELELLEISNKAAAFYSSSIKEFQILLERGEKEALIAAIVRLRQQNISTQARINQTKARIKETRDNLVLSQASSKHDKYTRVMEGLTSKQADLRETWDSDDVLAIDDYVLENGVSYDEALAAIERRNATMDFSQALAEDE